jgi:hypothetical protein
MSIAGVKISSRLLSSNDPPQLDLTGQSDASFIADVYLQIAIGNTDQASFFIDTIPEIRRTSATQALERKIRSGLASKIISTFCRSSGICTKS